MLALHFTVEFDQLFVQLVLRVTIDFKLANIKLESSVAYLPKLEKNTVLNMCRYLKRFYTWKKINSIFLKFEKKNIKEIGQIIPAEKADSKT